MTEDLVLTLTCPDRPRIVHSVTGAVADAGGNILESQQYGDATSARFHMRVEAEGITDSTGLREQLHALADELDMTWSLTDATRPIPTVIMASKEGHCLTDLLHQTKEGQIPIDVVGIVSNHEDMRPVAEFYGVPYFYVPVTKDTKAEAEAELLRIIEEQGAELVVLARYMQILSDRVCTLMEGQIINIHHSFLPSFKGAQPYRQAHDRGVKLIGATAHYVTADLDEGPIIEQDVARVTHADSVSALVSQGQDVERRVLSRAVRWHAQNRVLMNGDSTVVFS